MDTNKAGEVLAVYISIVQQLSASADKCNIYQKRQTPLYTVTVHSFLQYKGITPSTH